MRERVRSACWKTEVWRDMESLNESPCLLSEPTAHVCLSAPKLWRLMQDLSMSLWPHWYSPTATWRHFWTVKMWDERSFNKCSGWSERKCVFSSPDTCMNTWWHTLTHHPAMRPTHQPLFPLRESVTHHQPVCRSGPHSLPGMPQKNTWPCTAKPTNISCSTKLDIGTKSFSIWLSCFGLWVYELIHLAFNNWCYNLIWSSDWIGKFIEQKLKILRVLFFFFIQQARHVHPILQNSTLGFGHLGFQEQTGVWFHVFALNCTSGPSYREQLRKDITSLPEAPGVKSLSSSLLAHCGISTWVLGQCLLLTFVISGRLHWSFCSSKMSKSEHLGCFTLEVI